MLTIAHVLILIPLVAVFVWPHLKTRRWRELPSVDEYLKVFPRCKTSHGIRCRKCGSGSIRHWGLEGADDGRRIFICNHCGIILYRNED
jgi:hypothetical protein